MNTDIVIVGAGPAGIFTAIEMIRKGSKKRITIVEKGQPIEKRRCPKTVTKHCVNCRPYCHITTGFSGAGAFSDGKLSLSHEVGGDFPTLIGAQNAQDLIDYTDGIYLEFGADSHIEGIGNTEEVREIRRRAIQTADGETAWTVGAGMDVEQARLILDADGEAYLCGTSRSDGQSAAAVIRMDLEAEDK